MCLPPYWQIIWNDYLDMKCKIKHDPWDNWKFIWQHVIKYYLIILGIFLCQHCGKRIFWLVFQSKQSNSYISFFYIQQDSSHSIFDYIFLWSAFLKIYKNLFCITLPMSLWRNLPSHALPDIHFVMSIIFTFKTSRWYLFHIYEHLTVIQSGHEIK